MTKRQYSFMNILLDVWGLSKVNILDGSYWFVIFINNYIRMTQVCLMKSKVEINLLFHENYKMIES